MINNKVFFLFFCILSFLTQQCQSSPSSAHKLPLMPRGGSTARNPLIRPVQSFLSQIRSAKTHLTAAAVARSVSIFAMYPVDTIKTRAQMGKPLLKGGLYGGVGGSLFGQVPYGVLTFGSYEMYKSYFTKRFESVNPIWIYAASAILGDITGSAWLCPSEVIKQQMQAGMHSSTLSAIKSISSRGLTGFYQGYFGGIARDVPFRVAQLTSYEVTKSLYLRTSGKSQLSPLDTAFCGALAGTFSAALTNPVDVIKTKLMTASDSSGGSVWACAKQISRVDGWRGFTRGMIPRVVYIAPSVAIFFIAYEQVQQRLTVNAGAKNQ